MRGLVERRSPRRSTPSSRPAKSRCWRAEIRLLNEAKTPPFQIAEDAPVSEDVRLRYRYLDLRRPRLQANIGLRHRVAFAVRRYFDEHGLLGDRDADPDQVDAGRRARLPGAEPGASRRVLRAAAVAADLQADPDDCRHRPLFPDHALLPRRGPARRPPAGVHAGRRRDVVRARGPDLRADRAADAARLQGDRPRRADRRSAGCRTPRRWRGTARTSPICAAGWRSPICPRCSGTPSSASSSRSSPKAA